jgi:hypothetical protein
LALADQADRQGVFAHGLKSDHKRLQMSDLPRNKKLKRVLACLVVAEIDQALVHDFCPRFRANIAPQIDIKFTP